MSDSIHDHALLISTSAPITRPSLDNSSHHSLLAQRGNPSFISQHSLSQYPNINTDFVSVVVSSKLKLKNDEGRTLSNDVKKYHQSLKKKLEKHASLFPSGPINNVRYSCYVFILQHR